MVMTGTHAFTVTLETCMYAQSTIFLVILELIGSTHKFHVTYNSGKAIWKVDNHWSFMWSLAFGFWYFWQPRQARHR